MSKLYAVALIVASLLAMAALGMLILVVITEASYFAAPISYRGMSR